MQLNSIVFRPPPMPKEPLSSLHNSILWIPVFSKNTSFFVSTSPHFSIKKNKSTADKKEETTKKPSPIGAFSMDLHTRAQLVQPPKIIPHDDTVQNPSSISMSQLKVDEFATKEVSKCKEFDKMYTMMTHCNPLNQNKTYGLLPPDKNSLETKMKEHSSQIKTMDLKQRNKRTYLSFDKTATAFSRGSELRLEKEHLMVPKRQSIFSPKSPTLNVVGLFSEKQPVRPVNIEVMGLSEGLIKKKQEPRGNKEEERGHFIKANYAGAPKEKRAGSLRLSRSRCVNSSNSQMDGSMDPRNESCYSMASNLLEITHYIPCFLIKPTRDCDFILVFFHGNGEDIMEAKPVYEAIQKHLDVV